VNYNLIQSNFYYTQRGDKFYTDTNIKKRGNIMDCKTTFLNSGLTVEQAKRQNMYVYNACIHCLNPCEIKNYNQNK